MKRIGNYLLDLKSINEGRNYCTYEASNEENKRQGKYLINQININLLKKESISMLEKYSYFKSKDLWEIKDIVQTKNSIYLIYSFPEKKLSDCMKENYNRDKLLDIFQDLSNGICTLYKNKIVHRNINPQNIYYSKKRFFLGGFEMIKYFNDKSLLSLTEKIELNTSYSPPEMINDRLYSYKSDIYSLGVIIFELIYKCFPYTIDKSGKFSKSIDFPEKNEFAFMKQILKIMLKRKEEERANWSYVNDFLKEHDRGINIEFHGLYESPKSKSSIKVTQSKDTEESELYMFYQKKFKDFANFLSYFADYLNDLAKKLFDLKDIDQLNDNKNEFIFKLIFILKNLEKLLLNQILKQIRKNKSYFSKSVIKPYKKEIKNAIRISENKILKINELIKKRNYVFFEKKINFDDSYFTKEKIFQILSELVIDFKEKLSNCNNLKKIKKKILKIINGILNLKMFKVKYFSKKSDFYKFKNKFIRNIGDNDEESNTKLTKSEIIKKIVKRLNN